MIFVVGLILLVAWPLYNVALVALTANQTSLSRRHRRARKPAPTGGEPASFWIIVPCLNEERVVGRTVSAALELQGPAGTRTEVVVVDDGSDDATADVARLIESSRLHVVRRALPFARKGKGEALNAAYRYIHARVTAAGQDPERVAVGVIDGDGRGSRNMLTEVSRAMSDQRVGGVQCRVRIHNRDRLMGAVQDLEFGCIANASQLLRNTLGTVGLGGNGQFVRLSALTQFGWYSPWSDCLVEDLELGLRIHLAGGSIRYLSRASVTQQGLVDVRRLLRQRTRWAQGNLQCISYVPTLIASRKVSNAALLEILYYVLAPWFNAVGTVIMAALWGYATWRLAAGDGDTFLVTSWWQLAAATTIWAGALITPSLTWGLVHRWQLRDERLSRCLLAGLVYPAFLFLGLISTWRAIFRQVNKRNAWAKTERLPEEQPPNGQSPQLVGQT
jgi:1,2-diacylglycerol 3-beta-glucosyltransferase